MDAKVQSVHPLKDDKGVVGTIYLIHFERPFKHAKHYIGWTSDLDQRLKDHLSSTEGSALLRAVNAAGIAWKVVKTWTGTRGEERRLHNQKNSPARLCPECRKCPPADSPTPSANKKDASVSNDTEPKS